MTTPCWCDRLEVAQDCYECRTQRESPYTYGYLPRDCCLLNARPVRDRDELKKYRLVGEVADWWICPECHRTFSLEPAQMGKFADQRRSP